MIYAIRAFRSAISHTYFRLRDVVSMLGYFIQVCSIYLCLQTRWSNTTLSTRLAVSRNRAYPVDIIKDVHLLAQRTDKMGTRQHANRMMSVVGGGGLTERHRPICPWATATRLVCLEFRSEA